MSTRAPHPPTVDLASALAATLDYCAEREYRGYSLYDSHNGWMPFGAMGAKVSFYANQVVKRSPINLRPLLGVRKGINPKGMGLFLFALSELNREGRVPEGVRWVTGSMRQEMDYIFQWLVTNPSPGYSGYSWGYNFEWPKRDGSVIRPYTPSSVVTGFNARAVFAYYRATGSQQAADVLRGCAEFLLKYIPATETPAGLCYSYVPTARDLTVNANLLAAEILAYADLASGERRYADEIQRVLDFTRAHQNDDGSWYYSFSVNTGRPRKQIDFHQGYVLESIFRLATTYELGLEEYRSMLLAGLGFYRDSQFDDTGRAFWRYPRRWPVDIHNQSQGIITLSLMADLFPQGRGLATKILRYTLTEMRDARDGHFFYEKWPVFTVRTPYMRWSQAWMIVAMAQALMHETG